MNIYHYYSNKKCFSILESKTLRMSDVAKSNDYSELELFFPQILFEIRKEYRKKPFPFKYKSYLDIGAIDCLLDESYDYWDKRYDTGDFSNLMVCFSAVEDSLSQWRGYSDNGRGCCLTFSKESLEQYCDNSQGLLRFEQVSYLSDDEIENLLIRYAKSIIKTLKTLRAWIIDNMTHGDLDKHTDGLMRFNFNGILQKHFVDSLKYKSNSFHEECEWRIFLNQSVNKKTKLAQSKLPSRENGSIDKKKSYNDLTSKIGFHITDDDMIPFYSINLNEIENNGIVGIILGPKNNIRESDLKLFLQHHGYGNIEIQRSQITYR